MKIWCTRRYNATLFPRQVLRKRYPIDLAFTDRIFRVKILLNFTHLNVANSAKIIIKITDFTKYFIATVYSNLIYLVYATLIAL